MRPYIRHIVNSVFLMPLWVTIMSCQPSRDEQREEASTRKAQEVVDMSIEAHGGKLFDQVAASFDFRDKHYTAFRKNGAYVYTREFTDSLGQVKDVLTNDGFNREIDGKTIMLAEEKGKAYASSINSVIYFALLPYGLNDAAVNKEYLGKATIKGTAYHKVKVTFDQEGGGSDHEDQYIYWIHPERHTMDYLAYSFNVNKGGLRFREAYNRRIVKGLVFADYVNYEPSSDTLTLEKLDVAFENGGLKKLSDIDLKNITVQTGTF